MAEGSYCRLTWRQNGQSGKAYFVLNLYGGCESWETKEGCSGVKIDIPVYSYVTAPHIQLPFPMMTAIVRLIWMK
jgi:hypothetical protein